ncbi:MAG: dipeptide epimerase [Pseudomonadota bacterium]
MKLSIKAEHFPLKEPFTIAGHAWTTADVCTVEIEDGGYLGRGEGAPVFYHGETAESLVDELEAVRSEIEAGIDRAAAGRLLAPGGALCALDCALWDLEARRAQMPVHELAGLAAPIPLDSAITITLKDTETMAARAHQFRGYPLLKVKLGGDDDEAAIRAVRGAAPRCRITVDANTAWSLQKLTAMEPLLVELGVELIEQPMPPGDDSALMDFNSRIPIAADESCQTAGDVPGLVGKYQTGVIKLDKAGGLTGAIALKTALDEAGLELMVSCMVASSLGMAPARLIGTYCKTVDLDSPMNVSEDRAYAIPYENGRMGETPPELWGG